MLLYLYSMVQNEPIHLGHIVAEYLRHQSQYAKIGVLFSGAYITRLIMGISLLDAIKGAAKTIVPALLGLETMSLMGTIMRY